MDQVPQPSRGREMPSEGDTLVPEPNRINQVREFLVGEEVPEGVWLWAQDQGSRSLWLDVPSINDLPPAAKRGWKRGTVRVFEQPPPHAKRRFQGRLARHVGLLYLEWTDEDKPFRQIRDTLRLAVSLKAEALLRSRLEWDDLLMLHTTLATYPNHVIEFTTFDTPVGPEELRTLVWEIRDR